MEPIIKEIKYYRQYLVHVYCKKFIPDAYEPLEDMEEHSYFVAGDDLEELISNWARILFDGFYRDRCYHSLCGRDVEITFIREGGTVYNVSYEYIIKEVLDYYQANFDVWYSVAEDKVDEEIREKELADYERLKKKFEKS